jgi:CheY-like chemotaxis protein
MIKLLFVDDDKDVSELFKYIGNQERVWTITFVSGAEALLFLEHNQVDVIVLDLMLPTLDGLTIAEEIRRNEENQPDRVPVQIVFLTGAEINDTVRRVADRTRVKRIFRKPTDLLRMVREIKTWFSGESRTQTG